MRTENLPGSPPFDTRNGFHTERTVQRFDFQEGSAIVHHFKPEGANPTPVVLIQGFAVKNLRKNKVHVMTDRNREVVAVTALPFRGKVLDAHNPYGPENARKASLYGKVLDSMGVKKGADLMAISAGAAPGLIDAVNNKRFGRIVLINPVGINGPLKEIELVKRYTEKRKNRKDVAFLEKVNAVIEVTTHFSNLRRVGREIRDMARVNVYELCLQAAAENISISVILARNDRLFPLHEIYAHFENHKDEKGNKLPSPFYEIVEVDGLHDENSFNNPERVIKGLSLLEKMPQDS